MRIAKSSSPFVLLAALLGAGPVAAETLRCQVLNGNAVCAGSSGVSCQTINGRTTCVSGDGAVVQQFGSQRPPRLTPPPANMPEAERDSDADAEAMPPAPRGRSWPNRNLHIERSGPAGHWLSLDRADGRLRLNTDNLSVEMD
jgi:hypothetical protein